MSGSNALIPSLVSLIVGIVVGYILRYFYGRFKLQSIETKAIKIKEDSEKQAQAILAKAEEDAKAKVLEAREAIFQEKN